jgi:predicted nucleic acid-binding protein
VVHGAKDCRLRLAVQLAYLEGLMRQYRPMDLADATLVHLARREAVSTVFAVDHDDIETYRIGARNRLSIVPER